MLLWLLAQPASSNHNVSCTGGGSTACPADDNGTAATACCNVGRYTPDRRCYDPQRQACCHYDGGPAGPPAGALCDRGQRCCAPLCLDPVRQRCCTDQYGSGHGCALAETCQINGCGPAAPPSAVFRSRGNATAPTLRVALSAAPRTTLTFAVSLTTPLDGTARRVKCKRLRYTYDASGEFPGQGALLFNSSCLAAHLASPPAPCPSLLSAHLTTYRGSESAHSMLVLSRQGHDWAGTLLVYSGPSKVWPGGALQVMNEVEGLEQRRLTSDAPDG